MSQKQNTEEGLMNFQKVLMLKHIKVEFCAKNVEEQEALPEKKTHQRTNLKHKAHSSRQEIVTEGS